MAIWQAPQGAYQTTDGFPLWQCLRQEQAAFWFYSVRLRFWTVDVHTLSTWEYSLFGINSHLVRALWQVCLFTQSNEDSQCLWDRVWEMKMNTKLVTSFFLSLKEIDFARFWFSKTVPVKITVWSCLSCKI